MQRLLVNTFQMSNGEVTPYGGAIGASDPKNIDYAYRVVSDHIRAVCMALSDGINFGRTGAP